MFKKLLYLVILVFIAHTTITAQIKIGGRVFLGDSANHTPKSGVLVKTTAGVRAFTNDSGYYNINMQQSDTLEFYFKGKMISAYPFTYLTSFTSFNIYIDNNTGFANGIHDLGTVTVHSGGNKDSIAAREKYANIFNPKKSKISMGDNKWKEHAKLMGQEVPINTMDKKASLLDIGSVSDALNFKKKKRAKINQRFAIQGEQDNYVKRRFTKSIVSKFSGMNNDDSLNYFISNYAPTYDKLVAMNDLLLDQYIIDQMKIFRSEGIEKKEEE
ncbi:MAG: hypothetical protein PW786_12330 [Arachidicoccus sp.]|nr:hypothetical protein [Arachidicoccus sp.]